ncbi:hypothetical protein Scep_000463 [Stephania cephalantha]|uniref:Uncharacterized protein n=1 Tax=Stephania cephalantha TaxID=152367 RepID=A0AAP0L7N1_9MAGN
MRDHFILFNLVVGNRLECLFHGFSSFLVLPGCACEYNYSSVDLRAPIVRPYV